MAARVAEGVKVHTQGRVKHAPSAGVDGDVFSFRGGSTGCVMILEPMTPFLNYYEYEIQSKGAECAIGIGVGEMGYPLNRMPGWNRKSIGYHGDDGKLYHENGRGDRFGPTCTEGDRMGCGVDFESEVEYGYHEVFFTKNGQLVGDPMRIKRPVHGLYPIIGLHSRGEKVRYLGHWHRQRHSLLEPMVQDHSPSNVWLRSNGIKYLEDSLTLEYCGAGGASQDVSLAQGKYPLDRTNHYFEVEILDAGSLGAVAIGVGKSSYPLHSHPGWSSGAVGYHADDGKLFVEQGMGQEFGPSCGTGDKMGCGLIFDAHSETEPVESVNKADDDGDDGGSDSTEYSDDDSDISLDDLFDDEAEFYQQLLGREHLLGLGRGGFGRGRHRPHRGGLFGGGLNMMRAMQQRQRNGPRNLGGRGLAKTPQESVKGNSGSKCRVYFTKNGEKVGDTEVCLPKGGFYPLVGMLSKGEKVRVDLQPLTG